MKKINWIIIFLAIGVVYKLLLTSDGYFLFNMDNARDFLDVREMVELRKFRLIGPTSGIEGFFNGPGWYYLLAIPYVLSHGNPYSGVVLMIMLWAIGGYYLLKIAQSWGILSLLICASLWVSSNFITLTTSYSFNPNPVVLLMPVFIFYLWEFLNTGKLIYSMITFLLSGLFFNFEMASGIFTPLIITIAVLLIKREYLKRVEFWLGVLVFFSLLVPQVFFDLKHQLLMSKSLIKYFSTNSSSYNLASRAVGILATYYQVISGTLINSPLISKVSILIIFLTTLLLRRIKDLIGQVLLVSFLIPLLLYILLPIKVMPWHIGGSISIYILLFSFCLTKFRRINFLTYIVVTLFSLYMVGSALANLEVYKITNPQNKTSSDPSIYKNETTAINFVYNYTHGRNFKVYSYLPSVYDYPYQYLFWWYGKNNYGYTPKDFAYLPNKFDYIKEKDKFIVLNKNLSDLVFLIIEPDYPDRVGGWLDNFKNYPLISKQMVGPLEIEVRNDIKR